MKKHAQRGFTLIELMVVLVMLGIVGILAAGIVRPDSGVSWGINGMTEVRCIAGMQFVVGEGGQARQVLDGAGRGVACKAGQQ